MRVVADGEHGGMENTGWGEVGSTDGVDAVVLAVERALSNAASDRLLRNTA